ncbi:MAG: ABC transporter substrate-binding protein [Candidatus Humimicrobiaceae bacterium]
MNKKKKFFNAFVLVAIVAMILSSFIFSGCSSNLPENEPVAAETTAAQTQTTMKSTTTLQEQLPIEVTDGMGNTVKLDKPAQKVIVYSPAVLEIFSGLDAMEKIAEVDSWSVQNNEPLAEGFEGAGDTNGINFEVVTKINPDLVIVVGSSYASNSSNDFGKLADLGFKVYMSNSISLDGTYVEIENIGKLIGKEEEGKALSSELKVQVEEIYSKVKDIPEDSMPTVFYMVWNDPLMSAGKNTFVDELITKAGGINIVARDGISDWSEYSLEKLVSNNPDIIIAPMSLAANPDVILKDNKYATINAVVNNKVYSLPDNPISRPNQNVIKGLSLIAMAVHPEIFGEFKITE